MERGKQLYSITQAVPRDQEDIIRFVHTASHDWLFKSSL